MDSYRRNREHYEPTELFVSDVAGGRSAGQADRGDDDEIGREPPPLAVGQDERRMQVRAYNYWATLLGDRACPRIADLTTASLPDFGTHAVVLDFSRNAIDPAVTMLGQTLASECDAAVSIERLSDVPPGSLLSRVTDHCRQTLASAAPIGFEAEFINQRGKTLLFRGILLPFSGDTSRVDHIMGVINWKELAEPTMTAQLEQELAIVIDMPAARSPIVRLAAWADGPASLPLADEPVVARAAARFAPLAEWQEAARASAQAADALAAAGTTALHGALGQAWDLALMSGEDPAALRRLAIATGLNPGNRSPLVLVVKLVFGANCGRARLAAFTLVLAHARRHGIGQGRLADFLGSAPGGLNGVIREERLFRLRTGRPSIRTM